VYLDGSNTGRTTNTTLTGVSAGTHTVGVFKDGYGDYETSVSVSVGQTASVNTTLKVGSFTEDFNDGVADHWKNFSAEAKWTVNIG